MSPASQSALEVERYIGSCLISSNVRQAVHKPLVVKKQEALVRGKSRGCYGAGQQQNYANGGEQQCQVQYGSGSSWAGAPLISMTSSPRRCNQRSSPTLCQQQQQQHQQQQMQLQLQSQQSQQQQQQQHEQQLQQQQQEACEHQQQVAGHLHKSPLSRLSIHTQGAPLILAGRFHNRGKIHGGSQANAACNNILSNGYTHSNGSPASSSPASSSTNGIMNGATPRCQPPRRAPRPSDVTKKQPTNPKECSSSAPANGKEAAGTNIANIDSLSIASDESSGSNNSENSLPRIIKPRKRRKKDRKPPNNVASTVDVTTVKHEEQQLQLQQHLQQQHHQQQHHPIVGGLVDQSNIVTMKPYHTPVCYDQQQQRYDPTAPPHLRNHRRLPMGRESAYDCRMQSSGCASSSMQEQLMDVRQRYAHRHAQVKVLDDNRNIIVPASTMRAVQPKGYRHGNHHHHHYHNNINNGNNNNGHHVARYLHDYGEPSLSCENVARDGLGSCQCRYCDPSGLIWDVDRNGYSPFLTPPPSSDDFCNGHYGQMPALFLSRVNLGCQEQQQQQQQPQQQQQQQQIVERLFDVDNSRIHHERIDNNAVGCAGGNGGNGSIVLRRSWSDPTSYFSEEISAPSKDVGVIGDRGQSENGKRRTLWRGDTFGVPAGLVGSANTVANDVSSSPKGLEVSTEIVTSPNGHRDLEIKFYSPSPSVPILEEDKSIFAEEAGEDEEDFSDIWSYHESKLQQDFRTLLQAEE